MLPEGAVRHESSDDGHQELGMFLAFAVGTIANIVQSLQLPDGYFKVLLEGVGRAAVSRYRARAISPFTWSRSGNGPGSSTRSRLACLAQTFESRGAGKPRR
jgi:Lon protease-like protein